MGAVLRVMSLEANTALLRRYSEDALSNPVA
jgi:hypothetical protein